MKRSEIMVDVGQFLFDTFGAEGEVGVLLCIFLIFFIDALVFPTFPELFFILGFSYDPSLLFGLKLLLMAVLAEWIGIFSLYYVTKHIRIPKRVTRIVGKYVDFLVLKDEKLLLLNRIAPMIPFAGAFMHIVGWDLRKCWLYITIGCLFKYGIIMILSNYLYEYYSNYAQTLTIVMLVVILAISFLLSFVLKKRNSI